MGSGEAWGSWARVVARAEQQIVMLQTLGATPRDPGVPTGCLHRIAKRLVVFCERCFHAHLVGWSMSSSEHFALFEANPAVV